MRVFKLSILTVCFGVFLLACSGTGTSNLNTSTANNSSAQPANVKPSVTPPDLLSSARANYKEHCARCHQDNGEGGKVASDIGEFKVPSFKRPSVTKAPDAELIEVIEKGEEEMPAFKNELTAAEISDLVKFIRSEFQGAPGGKPTVN